MDHSVTSLQDSTDLKRIHFDFRVEKFADAMAFLAERATDLTTLKAAKLLYLADREHLLRHGRPILGDWYACMEHGPVPARAFDLLKQVRDPEKTMHPKGIDRLLERIKFQPIGKHPRLERQGNAPLDALSASEIEVLQRISDRYGEKDPYELAEITHTHFAWKRAIEADEHVIDYRAFFADEPGSEAMLELMELEQEDRDFISQLTPRR